MFFKNKIDKPTFIKVLEYGEEIGLEGTNLELLFSWAIKQKNLDGKTDKGKAFLRKLFDESFHNLPLSGTDKKSVLKIEYYFRLIEWRELQEVRKNAREARWLSLFAILVSIGAVLFSVFGSISLDNSSIENIGKSVTTHINNKK